MSSPEEPQAPSAGTNSKARSLFATLLRFVLPLIILVAALLLSWYLLRSAPEQTTSPTLPPAPVVEVLPVEVTTHSVQVVGFGNIIPARSVHLAPEVTGRIMEVNESVQPGGKVTAGSVLFRIDARDYQLAVGQAEAALVQSEADLAMEKARAESAKADWESFQTQDKSQQASPESLALVFREPQLGQAQAATVAAANALKQAKLNLERSRVHAPFDATVLNETLEVGQRVGPNEPVLELAGTETFWAQITVPASQLERLRGKQGAAAQVLLSKAMDHGVQRTGRLVRVLPGLDPQGRMGRVLIAIDDPLSLDAGFNLPVLPLDSYVRVELDAGMLQNVMRAPREALRNNQQVWVRDAQGLLQFRDIEIIWRDEDEVFLRGDFLEGDHLITSYLNDPLPGQTIAVRDTP